MNETRNGGGDGTAERFEKLYRANYARVLGFFMSRGLRRADAEDLTQKTFFRVHRLMASIREPSPLVERSYTMKTALSTWKNELRHRAAIRRGEELTVLDDPDPERSSEVKDGTSVLGRRLENAEEVALRKEREVALRKVLDDLPPRMRQVVLLRVQGEKYREIAASLSISLDTVKTVLFQARQRLRTALGEAVDDLFDRLDGES